MNALSFVAKFSQKIANLHKAPNPQPQPQPPKYPQVVPQPSFIKSPHVPTPTNQTDFQSQKSNSNQNRASTDDKDDKLENDVQSFDKRSDGMNEDGGQFPREEEDDEEEEEEDKGRGRLAIRGKIREKDGRRGMNEIDGDDQRSMNQMYEREGIIEEGYEGPTTISKRRQAYLDNQIDNELQQKPQKPTSLHPKKPSFANQPTFNPNPNLNSQDSPTPTPSHNPTIFSSHQNDSKTNLGILTDGRQYDQPFRRKFVKQLSQQLLSEPPQKVNQRIKTAAHSISVHVYEVKIWIISYKLIFSIEKLMDSQGQGQGQKRMGDRDEKMNLIKKVLLNYLVKNRFQKKYRFCKIAGCVFQNFGFKEIKVQPWLKQFIRKYQNELKGVEIAHKSSQNCSEDSDSSKPPKKRPRKSNYPSPNNSSNQQLQQFLSKRKPPNSTHSAHSTHPHPTKFKSTPSDLDLDTITRNQVKRANGEDPFSELRFEDVSMYPVAFKEKLARKIGEEIWEGIDGVFREKGQEYCLGYNVIKNIYAQYGQYIFQKKLTQKIQPTILIPPKPSPPPNKKPQSLPLPKFPQHQPPQSLQPPQPQPQPHQLQPHQSQDNQLSQNIQFSKLQSRLLLYLSSNPNCHIQMLERESQKSMDSLEFLDKWKLEVRNQWFCLFLRKHRLTVGSDKRVVSSSKNMAIMSTAPNQDRRPIPQPPPSHKSLTKKI